MRTRLPLLAALLLATLAVATGCASATKEQAGAADSNDFIGTWQTNSSTTGLILVIEPSGEGVMILSEPGTGTIGNFKWRPLPGGIVTEGLPMFRFWHGENPDRARVEMEPLPAQWTDAEMQRFSRTFFMSRLRPVDESMTRRGSKVPDSWMKAKLPAEWDQTAGQRREYPAR